MKQREEADLLTHLSLPPEKGAMSFCQGSALFLSVFHILSLAKLLVEKIDHDLNYRYKAILLVSTLATTLAHHGLRVD